MAQRPARVLSATEEALWAAFTSGWIATAQKLPPRSAASTEPVWGPVDLHGLTVGTAHAEVLRLVEQTSRAALVVITGRSGVIRREFPFWLATHPKVRRVETMNGGGAFRIHLVPPPKRGSNKHFRK